MPIFNFRFSSLKNQFKILMGFLLFLAPLFSNQNPNAFPKVNPQFWNLETTTINHDSISLKNYRGKYLLINFWGEWCVTCVEEIPFLLKQKNKYGNGPLKMISFLKYADSTKALRLIHKSVISWPQIVLTDSIEKLFSVQKFPTNLLISPEGEIVMNGFHMHYQDFKRRLGDVDSATIIQKNEIIKGKK